MYRLLRAVAALAAATSIAAAAVPGDITAEHLAITDWDIQTPATAPIPGGGFALDLTIDGAPRRITLEPRSVRSPTFRPLLAGADGELIAFDAPAPTTYRGETDLGEPVAASLAPEGWTLFVRTEAGLVFAQPLDAAERALAPAGSLVVFRGDDVVPLGDSCGVEEEPPVHHLAQRFAGAEAIELPSEAAPTGTPGEGEAYIAEVGIDCDYPYFQRQGFDTSATIAEVESFVNACSLVYERDAQVRFILSGVVIRSDEATEPYTSLDSGVLLGQMRAAWNGGQTGITHDLAHLFSGRNFSGSTIGRAYVGTVCGSSRYGINDMRFSTNFARLTALVCHEMGHNFSAQHCNSESQCNIMCSGIDGCNGIGQPNFAPVPIASISSHAASRSCLNIGSGSFEELPIEDAFAGAAVDPLTWPTATDAAIVNDPRATSAPSVLELGAAGELITMPVVFDASPTPYGMTMFVAGEGLDPGDAIVFESFNGGRGEGWIEINRLTVDDRPLDRYKLFDASIPSFSQFPGVTFRVRTEGGDADDRWRLDDFRIGLFTALHAPFEETFDSLLDTEVRWATASVPPVEVAPGVRAVPLVSGGLVLRTVNLDLALLEPGDTVSVSALAADPDAGDLRIQLRDTSGAWTDVLVVPASSALTLRTFAAELPASIPTTGSELRLFVSDGAGPQFFVDRVGVGVDPLSQPCPADFAAPAGELDIADVVGFLQAFGAGDPAADLASPRGLFDIADVVAFLQEFGAGCP